MRACNSPTVLVVALVFGAGIGAGSIGRGGPSGTGVGDAVGAGLTVGVATGKVWEVGLASDRRARWPALRNDPGFRVVMERVKSRTRLVASKLFLLFIGCFEYKFSEFLTLAFN